MRLQNGFAAASLLFALLAPTIGCYGPTSGSDEPSGCSNDMECKGTRVCHDGDCLEPGSFDAMGGSDAGTDDIGGGFDTATDDDGGFDPDTGTPDDDTYQEEDSGGDEMDTRCVPANDYESPETSCDLIDNDCDGQTDENLSMNCAKQQGVCAGASRECSNGSYPTCGASEYGYEYESTESSCDNKDNDCDGRTDENLSKNCSKQQGVCAGSTRDCSNGYYPSCGSSEYGFDYERTETSCDSKDNDCDGQTDEGCTTPNSTEPGDYCTSDNECRSGHCVSNTCAHRVFATSKRYDGDLGGATGADTTCETLAHNAGHNNGDGDWDPILATSGKSAKARADVSGAVYNMQDQKLADDETDFWDGMLDNAVMYDEDGRKATGSSADSKDVWTGSDQAGTSRTKDNCSDWSTDSASYDGTTGDVHHTDDWADDTFGNACDTPTRIYCISD